MSDVNPYQSPQEEPVVSRRPSMPVSDRWIWLWLPILLGLAVCVAAGENHWGLNAAGGLVLLAASTLVYACGLARMGNILFWQVRWSRLRKTLSFGAVLGFLATILVGASSALASCIDQLSNDKSQAPGHWSALAMIVVFVGFYEVVWWPTRRSLGNRRHS